MLFRSLLAASVVAIGGAGAAHAQAAACAPLKALMANSHAQVKALRGAEVKNDKETITYVSKTQLPGFKDCTIQSDRAIDDIVDYWQHHLSCDAVAANSEAATQAVEALWACTKDSFTERAPDEAFIGGKYRVIGFEAEAPTAGRGAGLVSFGDTDFARVDVEKDFEASAEYDIHLYWLFLE